LTTTVSGAIDVWDAMTFDLELTALLERNVVLIRNYTATENEIFLFYDYRPDPQRPTLRPQNPYTSDFVALEEEIGKRMLSRTLRAWHYTRLTAPEVDRLFRDGIHTSTPATLRTRLDFLVASGKFTSAQADRLYIDSPFHGDQMGARLGKFWMVSHPVAVQYGGVKRLLGFWGGEVASFSLNDPEMLAMLEIGKARVIEIAVPLALTGSYGSYSAGQAAIASFGRTHGCITSKHCFDLYVTAPLRPETIIRVHTEGETSFAGMGLTYPVGYRDVDDGYWKELTGEN